MADRRAMDEAIKSTVVPLLRGMGFKGSLPHFRRHRGGTTDLVSFQFLSAGGAFVVEAGRVPSDGIDFYGRQIPIEKLNTTYLRHRHRVGAPPEGGDYWFRFDDDDANAVAQRVATLLAGTDLWVTIDALQVG